MSSSDIWNEDTDPPNQPVIATEQGAARASVSDISDTVLSAAGPSSSRERETHSAICDPRNESVITTRYTPSVIVPRVDESLESYHHNDPTTSSLPQHPWPNDITGNTVQVVLQRIEPASGSNEHSNVNIIGRENLDSEQGGPDAAVEVPEVAIQNNEPSVHDYAYNRAVRDELMLGDRGNPVVSIEYLDPRNIPNAQGVVGGNPVQPRNPDEGDERVEHMAVIENPVQLEQEEVDLVVLGEFQPEPRVFPVIVIDSQDSGEEVPHNVPQEPTASTSRQEPSRNLAEDPVPPCKRPRLSDDEPVKKEIAETESDDDDGMTCTICLDHWTSSGEHRLVSLKCGHLYGFSCIERWIKNQKSTERKCPTCKSKARMQDVRNVYGSKVKMIDTCELEELREKTKKLEHTKEELTREVTYVRRQNEDLLVKQREAQLLIQQLKSEKLVSQSVKKSGKVQLKFRAQFLQTIEISKTEGCRVLTFNEQRNLIVSSMPSPTMLFQGFSLKMIDGDSFRPLQTMPAHNKMIRDVAFSNDGKMLLSCGLDKNANVLCMDSNALITHFTTEMPLWSVSWDADNPWLLFTGGQNGIVQQFDIRSPGHEVSRLTTQGDMTPVASLVGIPKESGFGWNQGGVVSCRFRRLCPYERLSSDGFELHPCPVEGSLYSTRFDRKTEHILVSTRPSDRSPRAQHLMFQMSSNGREPELNLVQSFLGSTSLGVMSRPCIMPVMGSNGVVEDVVICSYVESESHVALWSSANGQKLQSIPSSDKVMDLCPIHIGGKTYLSSLSEKKLRIYKVEKA